MGYDSDECTRLNWVAKINKLRNLLECWKSKRNLTLFGKVQVIKCLAMAGLIYTATHCILPDNVVTEINKELYAFLWGKSEKIKRQILINNITDGGIGMIDVQSQFEALKASWMTRLLHNPLNVEIHWAEIPIHYLNKLGNNMYVARTNCCESDTLTKIPKFYQEVVKAYSKMNYTSYEKFKDNLLHQPIFGNKYISYKKKRKSICPYFINWINSGLRYIGDLKIENGVINTQYLYDNIKIKINIHNEIALVIKSLRGLIKGISIDPKSTNLTQKPMENNSIKKAKYFYEKISSSARVTPNVVDDWKNVINMNNTYNLKTIMKNKVLNIKDKKLAETNFKILYNVLPCGYNLKRWKKIQSDKCSICNASETILHLLYYCKYAQEIWSEIEDALDTEIKVDDIFLGHENDIINHIYSFILYYIYKDWLILSLEQKKRNTSPNTRLLKYDLERQCAIYKSTKTPVLKQTGEMLENITLYLQSCF